MSTTCVSRHGLALPFLPPHVITAASQQESCARVLLFRGANKDVRNYNSQTAFQVQAELGRGRGRGRGVFCL